MTQLTFRRSDLQTSGHFDSIHPSLLTTHNSLYNTEMLHIILYQPEIPPNTGNIIRLCANTGASLHLIHPMGFDISEKQVRRAGLDYHDLNNVIEYQDYEDFLARAKPKRILAVETCGTRTYDQAEYQEGDFLLFGPETRGLPAEVINSLDPNHTLRIPMHENSRSLNLSNSVAVVLYEAWRQLGFTN